ncbi:hypothetical protein [Synechococcus sp. CB0205]|uniref:hypothetical protein n=1 Tax=Synechococcus sp. CB0205 TaxID=232363 RepID=UPI000200270D|nr:hypothetical protein [Synechococcus sp. CB0205]
MSKGLQGTGRLIHEILMNDLRHHPEGVEIGYMAEGIAVMYAAGAEVIGDYCREIGMEVPKDWGKTPLEKLASKVRINKKGQEHQTMSPEFKALKKLASERIHSVLNQAGSGVTVVDDFVRSSRVYQNKDLIIRWEDLERLKARSSSSENPCPD